MGKIKLLHGSDHIIEKPDLLLGKTNNDYDGVFIVRRNYLWLWNGLARKTVMVL